MRHFRTALAPALVGLGLTLALTSALASAPALATPDEAPSVAGHADSRLGARGGSLSFSPAAYVGGQALTFSGSLGVRGARRITLQQHMNRPGDQWFAVRGFSGSTAADGSFSFSFPAPAMLGIRYRVVAKGGAATPPVSFRAKGQDLTMWVAGPDPTNARVPGQPVAGVPFTLSVDTTPSLVRRPETIGLPVFAGRTLTLQRRVDGDTWETLGTSLVLADGMGYFPGVTSAAGTVVYRVRQEDVVSDGHRIGWMQTFPAYVTVLDAGEVLPAATAGRPVVPPVARTVAPTGTQRRGAGAASATASSRYGWYPTLWDYTWEAGQSLTSPPDVGSVRTGWWQDYADGAGRVSRQNGGLYLDSQRSNAGGPGDFGTTRATLVGAAQAYGRWEARLRLKTAEATARDFAVLVELVPERAEDYACGRRNITLAQVAAHSSAMSFGVKADTRQWTRTRTVPSLVHTSPAVAVEVAPDHITWFWDGKPIGTVKDRAAVSGVPMTLRFSMVGDQTSEHNQTGVVSDWQRGFALGRGRQVRSGPALQAGTLTTCES
ncbi:hypothetical protein [Nocardioides sp. Soil805]|uniref:hypothetical protein n=1 Tax=Nocardioides sp. Soil805 TaxID=1736416 RepID=UPI000702FA03|nr:hypothetical protein [Nocardioides sp. Soil805]KRF30684.1 hypothetical protein ASG94_19395 [Nocardioides sp. Soil805]